MKKKFLALALTAVMALSLAACGGDTQSTDTDADTSGDESASGSQTYTVGIIQQVQHEALAHPRINWDFLTGEVERKWGMFKGKLADVEQSPWVQQTELQDALAKMDYALTRLLSRM